MPTPEFFDDDFHAIPDILRLHVGERPDRAALIQDEREVSYAEFDALADRVAAGFQRDGLKVGEAIAICATTSINYLLVYLGALRAGLTVCPLAPSSTPDSLAGMVADCGARAFFLDAGVAAEIEPVMGRIAAPTIALDESSAGLAFSAWLPGPGRTPAPVEIAPDLPFNIIYSSGTTGAPKGIVQPHLMRWMHVRRGFYDSDAVTLISTPLYSNTTLVSVFPTIARGGTLVLMPRFDVVKFLTLSQQHRVTHAMLVPVQYKRLMEHPDFDRYDLSSYRNKSCTSAPFKAELKADILKRWPGGLVEFYGMTEGGGTCRLEAHLNPDKLHTVGKPVEGHEILLIGEDGRPVVQGEIGEVVGHSPSIMKGYHNQPAKTAEAEWYDEAGRRFIRTGDVGRFDEDGFLTLMDRKKDMIISGGFNIYPSDLEQVVAAHPDVAEAAVVGVPSDQWGETPVGFVALKPGQSADPETIRAWANARLGKTQRLADLQILDSIPRSHIGKVMKRELRETYVGAAKS